MKTTHNTFTARFVTDYVNKKLNQEYSLQFVRKLMKEDAKITFKKVKPRPNIFDFKWINNSRKIYAVI